MFVTGDFLEMLQQQIVIGHAFREVFIMFECMIDAIPGGFASVIMGLAEKGERDTTLIGDLTLSDVILKQELGLQCYDKLIHGNVFPTEMSSNFACFTGKDREDRSNLVLLTYIECGELVQDGAKKNHKRFIFLSCRAVFDREQLRED